MLASKSRLGKLTSALVVGAAGAVALALFMVAASLLSTPSQANSYFYKETGQSCGSCHVPGTENSPTPHLSGFGRSFQSAFRECSSCALRDYNKNRRTAPTPQFGGGGGGGGQCSRFTCNSHNVCRFRIRFANGGTRDINMRRGEAYTVRNVHSGDRWCFIEPDGTCEMKGLRLDPC